MSDHIVPTRFGLKYSPKPMIAIEYHRAAPNSGLATMKVTIEKLKPATYDVQGVVDALQTKYPRHLGSDVVNILQLKRLVTHLLVDGRPNLPQAYLSLPAPSFDDPPEPPLQKARRGNKPLSISEILGMSSGPTPAPTPEAPHRVTRAQPDDGVAVLGSGSHRPGGNSTLDRAGAGAGAASVEGKRYGEGRSSAAKGRSVAAEQRQLAPEERSMATLSAALERVRLSSPKEISPPPQERNSSDDVEQRQEDNTGNDFSRQLEKRLIGLPRGDGAIRSDLRETIIMDDKLGGVSSVKREEKEAVAKRDDDCDDDDRTGEDGDKDEIDGGGTVDRALPSATGSAFDIAASVDEAGGLGRSDSRQKNSVVDEEGEEHENEGQDKKLGNVEDTKGENGEVSEEGGQEKEVTEALEIEDDEESEEGGGAGIQGASGEQKEEVETCEITAKLAQGEDGNTTRNVSNTADAAEDATIASTAPGRVGNVAGLTDTLRQSTKAPDLTHRQADTDDSARNLSPNTEHSILSSGVGRTEDEIMADIDVPVSEAQAASAKPSTPSSPSPLPTSLAAILAPPRSLSPPSSQPETGASSGSSMSGSSLGASALGGGMPLPPLSGGRARFGLLGNLPPVGGRGLPSLSLRSGAGLSEEAKAVDSFSIASAFPGPNRSDDTSTPPPPPPPPGVLGLSAGAEESLPSDDAPVSSVAPRAFTGSAGSARLSSTLGDAPTGSRDEDTVGTNLRPGGSESQGGDAGEATSKSSAAVPPSPRQHQGQEEEEAGAGVGSTADARDSDRDTAGAGGGEKAQGERRAGDGEASGGGYFSDSGGEIPEEEIPEEVSSDDDISFEQDSSDDGGGGAGAGEGGDDDYFS